MLTLPEFLIRGFLLHNQFSNNHTLPIFMSPIVLTERFAVIIHFFEGVIAAIYAPSKNKPPLQYGVYTFFVGTVGLIELFKQENKLSSQ